ncbi:MAG TPA: hypothetical protein VMF32_03750 [Xanthobacteraceae bacterium]|nr:hypothetical protein [Xanthobacteraceae bacterium]
MTGSTNVIDFLARQLTDVETAWSIGTFGAIAEFTRDGEEAAALDRGTDAVSVVTARGGMRIEAHKALRPIASELLTAQSWSQRVALCLPEAACAMSSREVLTEVGPDLGALRAEDRAAVLFDLGLGTLQLDACVRVADVTVADALRRWVGQSLFAPANGAMGVILAANPHRAFISRVGRVEVFQPIPPPDGKSPDGPHTHVLPRLLRHKRTHAATEALPAGWIPCAHFYPPHPMRDAFGHRHPFRSERHAAFQTLLAHYGDPQLVDIKRRVVESVVAGKGPSAAGMSADRFARAAVRVALRQLQAIERSSPALSAWLSAHDRLDPEEPNDSIGDHPCTA